METNLPPKQRRFFRDQLREARAGALLDSEGFHPIVAAFERLGAILNSKGVSLGHYRDSLLMVARRAKAVPSEHDDRGTYTPLEVLFTVVKDGRNDAVHQGAYARHLVRHCIELALHIEEGLMADSKSVADFMVRVPTCAEAWQPVALARQQMLTNSFSFLPIWFGEQWQLLSDHAIALYLSESPNQRDAVRDRISEACESGALVLAPAVVVEPEMEVRQALQICHGRPVLIVEAGRLVGIATPFDLL
jgi:hypothetical protein